MGASAAGGGVNAAPSPLAHALSGAVGAVVAMALLYPLDQVRAILQVCVCIIETKIRYVTKRIIGLRE